MLLGIARAYALDSLRNAQQSGRPIFQHTPPPSPPAATPPASATLPAPSSLAALYPPHRRVHVGYVSADWTGIYGWMDGWMDTHTHTNTHTHTHTHTHLLYTASYIYLYTSYILSYVCL
jgi:hypothetical protein